MFCLIFRRSSIISRRGNISHKVEIMNIKIDCLFLCEAETRCVGFNFRITATNGENCQLTNVTKKRNSPIKGDWILSLDIEEVNAFSRPK